MILGNELCEAKWSGMFERRRHQIAGRGIPDARDTELVRADDPAPVLTEGCIVNLMLVFKWTGNQWAAIPGVPNHRRKILTGGHHLFAVRTERGIMNSVEMSQWRADTLSGFGIPDLGGKCIQSAVPASRDEQFAIRTELRMSYRDRTRVVSCLA